MLPKTNVTRVFLICSGLGRVSRGYESFTRECFDALADEITIDLTLFKGGGTHAHKEKPLWNLHRNNPLAIRFAKVIGKTGYWIEQVTFSLSLLPYIMRQNPDVIFLSDTNIGNLLWHWRRITRKKYKLLFSNGGPMKPPYPRWDYVQQVAPSHLEAALAVGHDPQKQELLPYGIKMTEELSVLSPTERNLLRERLHLPLDRPIVLSVGALNKSHKRMDYVIQEVAALPEPRPYLLLLGQEDAETLDVRALAKELLGEDKCQLRTVPYDKIADYYRAADIFVLASLAEGFGRVFLEAMTHGMPCLAHDYAVTRYVFDDANLLGDFHKPDMLSTLLCEALQKGYNVADRQKQHQSAFDRFSWQHLKPSYLNMIQICHRNDLL
jgi:1,2-diacylglycerol 3-alpha-glucosyltransferase